MDEQRKKRLIAKYSKSSASKIGKQEVERQGAVHRFTRARSTKKHRSRRRAQKQSITAKCPKRKRARTKPHRRLLQKKSQRAPKHLR